MSLNPSKKSPHPDDLPRSAPGSPSTSVLGDPLQVGIVIVGVTGLFGASGWWLDRKLHTFPIFLFIGAVLGFFGIIYSFVKRLKAADQKPSNSAGDRPSA